MVGREIFGRLRDLGTDMEEETVGGDWEMGDGPFGEEMVFDFGLEISGTDGTATLSFSFFCFFRGGPIGVDVAEPLMEPDGEVLESDSCRDKSSLLAVSKERDPSPLVSEPSLFRFCLRAPCESVDTSTILKRRIKGSVLFNVLAALSKFVH